MAKLQAGDYRGRCTGAQDVKFGKSSEGNLQIGLLFEVTAGECKGQRSIWYGGLGSEDAQAFTRKALMACGWDGRSWTELNGLTKNCVRLIFEEDGKYVKLRYVNPDTSVKFKQELTTEEARRELESLGLAERPRESTSNSEPEPYDDAAPADPTF